MNYINSLDIEIDPHRKTVLVINHLFDQDLRALRLANQHYNLVILDFEILFKSGRLYFSKPVWAQRAPYVEEAEQNRVAYFNECRLIFNRIRERWNPGVIVVPSDGFAFIREFIAVAREDGIKTVVLDKEGTISPYAFEAVAKRIRDLCPFMSDHIYLWSERQREFWNKIGVADDKITIIGQARSDLFHVEKNRDIDALFPRVQPLIGYFSFDDSAYMPRDKLDRGMTWRRLKTETLEDLMVLAKEHPNYNFVIKAHPQQLDLGQLREQYRRENLKVVGGARIGNELIQRSELIIAFQTTAVIEAMLLKRKVIYTAWDENYKRYLLDDLLPFHKAPGIVVAQSRDRFNEVCRRFFAGDFSDFDFSPAQRQAREEFVNEYLWRPDGHVCERFFKELDRFLGETPV